MIVKKYAHVENIGMALFLTDLVMIIIACFVFDIKTALYSFVGLVVKSFMIDAIIENIMLRKSIMLICDDKDVICDYITNTLEKSATYVEARGAYTGERNYIVFSTLTKKQAIELRSFIHQNKLHAFMSVMSTSEVLVRDFFSVNSLKSSLPVLQAVSVLFHKIIRNISRLLSNPAHSLSFAIRKT